MATHEPAASLAVRVRQVIVSTLGLPLETADLDNGLSLRSDPINLDPPAIRRIVGELEQEFSVEIDDGALTSTEPADVGSLIDLVSDALSTGTRSRHETEPGAEQLTDTEQLLATMWQKILDVDEVHSESNFFEFGGNSMDAFRVANMIKETFDVYIPMKSIMTLRTLGSLAAAIDTELASANHPAPDRTVVTEW
ncbi:acyl carrier protein [Streptomyces sp. DSM 40750]|uniref:acyl carrier protein n=1 Tax=Streptomyces sp. DSM 40750 TaxID=2801030 RepID=UPI00214C127E|nr:phosphopantetheine-binding protein [Streptomyces sp. DSM 40750]UUU25939.1 phosphopantetheine-binding protein [Streptomyces sp. DSM 40750]